MVIGEVASVEDDHLETDITSANRDVDTYIRYGIPRVPLVGKSQFPSDIAWYPPQRLIVAY
jgi:hypothetical protein